MDVGFFARAFMVCTCRKDKIRHKYLNENIWPKLHPAPEPTLIMWNNLGIGKYQRILRIFIINIISLFVMIFGFAGITYGQMLANGNGDKAFNTDDCDGFGTITQTMAENDFYDESSSNTILGCYCYE